MNGNYMIQEAAGIMDVSVHTLRYYEKNRLCIF